MDKKKRTRELIVFAVIVLALLAGCLLTPSGGESEPIQEVMRDAVLHEQNKVSLFGLIEVNPGLISAYIVTGILIVFALVCRLFVIPKFKYVPGRFQLVLEQIVGMFDGLAEGSSPHRNKFLRAYIFTAGVYIFVSTLFELLGIQVVTTSGHAVSLPAPLSDINGAIALGVMSYGVILFGGLIAAGVRGFLHALKDFSLPISMSFRLFGALLSGALVTELVYYYAALSYVLPVIVGVMFTLLHALIQTYVLVPLDIVYMQTIVFILVIAALVQMVEIMLKKLSPSLYQALGIFLPLITTNCAVLGVAILMIQKEFNLLQSVTYSVATALGFALALVLFAGIRERLDFEDVPKAFKGIPIALITAGILAMAFMGFSGLV